MSSSNPFEAIENQMLQCQCQGRTNRRNPTGFWPLIRHLTLREEGRARGGLPCVARTRRFSTGLARKPAGQSSSRLVPLRWVFLCLSFHGRPRPGFPPAAAAAHRALTHDARLLTPVSSIFHFSTVPRSHAVTEAEAVPAMAQIGLEEVAGTLLPAVTSLKPQAKATL